MVIWFIWLQTIWVVISVLEARLGMESTACKILCPPVCCCWPKSLSYLVSLGLEDIGLLDAVEATLWCKRYNALVVVCQSLHYCFYSEMDGCAPSPLGVKIYPRNACNMEEKILTMFSLQRLEAILNLDLNMMECID